MFGNTSSNKTMVEITRAMVVEAVAMVIETVEAMAMVMAMVVAVVNM